MSRIAPGEYTADQLARMADAFEAMARVFSSQWDRDFCHVQADRCRDLVRREPARLDVLAHEADRATGGR